MKLSQLQIIFAQILVDLELDIEEVAVIMLLLKTEQQMEKMVDYIEKNPTTTINKLLAKAVEIMNK